MPESAVEHDSSDLIDDSQTGLLIWLGGFLIGLGASLAHGGNDVLLVHGIPGPSPHALPVFAAMILGIAVALLMSERRGRAQAKLARSGEGRKEA